MKYPRCVAAARNGVKAHWELADALLAEIKAKQGDEPAFRLFEAVSEEVEREVGVTYAPRTLEKYRNIATDYPPKLRAQVQAKGIVVPFNAYEIAKPDQIFDLIAAAKAKKQRSLTVEFVLRVKEAWAAAAEREYQRELAERERQNAKAQEALRKAEDAKRKATSDAQRAKAAKEIEQAETAIDEYRVPPKINKNYKPEPETIPALLVPFDIDAECNQARDIGRYVNELLDEGLSQLDDGSLRTIYQSITETVAVWEKALAKVQKKLGKNVVKFPRRA